LSCPQDLNSARDKKDEGRSRAVKREKERHDNLHKEELLPPCTRLRNIIFVAEIK